MSYMARSNCYDYFYMEVVIICAIWGSDSGDSILLVHYVMTTVNGGSKKFLFSD